MHRIINTAVVVASLAALFVLAGACGPAGEEPVDTVGQKIGEQLAGTPAKAPECPDHDPPADSGAARAFLTQHTKGNIGTMLLLDKLKAFQVEEEVCKGEGTIQYRGVPVEVFGCLPLSGQDCRGYLYMLEDDFQKYFDYLNPHWDIWVIVDHVDPEVGGRCDNVPEGLGINCTTNGIDEITVKSIDP
jgi:hypothetical protein